MSVVQINGFDVLFVPVCPGMFTLIHLNVNLKQWYGIDNVVGSS